MKWIVHARGFHAGNSLVRIAFYCLLLLGPMFLSQGHTFYMRSKQHEVGNPQADNIAGRLRNNPYYTYHVACDILGCVCIIGWFFWLLSVFVFKLASAMIENRKGSDRDSQTSMIRI